MKGLLETPYITHTKLLHLFASTLAISHIHREHSIRKGSGGWMIQQQFY